MTRIVVLDPTAAPAASGVGPSPDVGSLASKTVGIRRDRLWRSFEWVAEEWAGSFRELGANVVLWTAGNRIGEEGERMRHELDDFVSRIDVAVVGLGN
jgi:hypothetical protein